MPERHSQAVEILKTIQVSRCLISDMSTLYSDQRGKYIFSLAEQREDEDASQINVVIDKALHPVLEVCSTSHKLIHVIKSELEPSVSLVVRISFLTTVEMAPVVTLWAPAAVQRQRSHTVECHQRKDASTGSDSVLNLQVWPLLLFIVFYFILLIFFLSVHNWSHPNWSWLIPTGS